MKKLFLAGVAAIGFGSTAVAADLPARMPVKAPPMVAPAFTWTGCYIGGFVGGAAQSRGVNAFDRNAYNGVPRDAWGYDLDSSVIGGGTLGCNYQPVGSPFVLGLEGEVGYMRLTGSAFDPFTSVFNATTGQILSSTRVGDWYGMITGRVGYSWDRALIYAKGGAAFVNVNTAVTDFVGVNQIAAANNGDMRATWTVGGGVEWAFDPNWSVKAEYMFIGLHNSNDQAACGVANTGGTFCWDHDLQGIHTAKVGLNYRFNWGAAPVVAKY
jgi:outer membrane immunogenic protein